jgi:putative ABC transport system substrate-binding protein
MLLGGAVATWPLAARAQQPAMPVVGYLYAGAPEATAHLVAAFRKGLSETGYVEGQNVAIEYRWTRNESDRLPELVADLVRRRVTVIAAPGSAAAAAAAKAATATIPVVYSGGADPVQAGLVASLNRPGGNVTGITTMNAETGTKRLGLLHELLPQAVRFAVLVNPINPLTEPFVADLRAAAAVFGAQIDFQLQRHWRNRYGICQPCSKADRRARGWCRYVVPQSPRAGSHAGGASSAARNLFRARAS